MAGTSQPTEVQFKGDATSLMATLDRTKKAMADWSAGVSGSMSGLGSVLGGVQGKMAAFLGLLAGGAGLKNAVEATVNLAKESNALSRALGVSGSAASVLAVAIGDIYQTSDSLIAVSNKVSARLVENEKAFKDAGIATRTANGDFVSSYALFEQLVAVLSRFKAGNDRNIEASKLLGKGYAEVLPFLALTRDRLEEARQKADALGLTMTEQSQDRVGRYRAAMNDVGDVVTGFKNAIGQALMPILSQLGNWFASIAPPALRAFSVALNVVSAALQIVIAFARILWEVLAGVGESVVMFGVMVGKVMGNILTGNFKEAANAAREFGGVFKELWSDRGEQIKRSMEEARAGVQGLFNATPATAVAGGAGTETSAGGKPAKAESRMAIWDARLTEMRQALAAENAAKNEFREFDKQKEIDYWKALTQRSDLSTEERIAVQRKYTAAVLDLQKDRYESLVASLEAERAAFANNMDERERITRAMAARVAERFGTESKEYQKVQKELVEIDRKRAEQQREVRAIQAAEQVAFMQQAIALERQEADVLLSLGLITREERLKQEQEFAQREMTIKRAALQEQLQLALQNPDLNPVERARIQAQIEELERSHLQRMGELRGQILVEQNATNPFMQFLSGSEQALEGFINNTLGRFKSWRESLADMFRSIYQVFVQEMVAKPIAQMAIRAARELAMQVGLTQAKVGVEAAGAAQSTAITAVAGQKNILVSSLEAAAGAYKAIAGIPYVGPFLAPAAAAAAMAAVGGLASRIFSASGGFDIPAGVNPMTQLHAEEMVLPASIANPLRDAIAGMTGAASGGGASNITVYAMDARSFESYLKDNPGALAAGIKHAQKRGH